MCLNGRRRRDEHPAVPITPAELAAAASAAVAAGAEAVHLHPRDRDGAESLHVADVGAAVSAVREACAGVPVGVSTGLWITGGDVPTRHMQVNRWTALKPSERPNFASVNLHEHGCVDLIELLSNHDIAVEAAVWTATDAGLLSTVDSTAVVRVLIEILDEPTDRATHAADEVMGRLDELAIHWPRLLHGEGRSTWPLIDYAGRLGLPTRIGLEDTLTGPDGGPVSDNAELVRLALAAWEHAAKEEPETHRGTIDGQPGPVPGGEPGSVPGGRTGPAPGGEAASGRGGSAATPGAHRKTGATEPEDDPEDRSDRARG